jgi:hypothetical protein
MATTPYLTSSDLLNSIKRRISFPAYQNTFTDNDILAMANEEMMISQVPSVLEYHESYYVFLRQVPLVSNVSKYPVPDRAIGMKLRDINYADSNGNAYAMSRVEDGNKTEFQSGISNSGGSKLYYLEGNDIVLTSNIIGAVTANLQFYFFLRPNQLVKNDRASIIQSFSKTVLFLNSGITAGDSLTITLGKNSPNPTNAVFTVVNTTITAASFGSTTGITTSTPHGQLVGSTFTVTISENSGSTPSINGTYVATSTGSNSFTIPVSTSAVGSNGSYALAMQFSIGSTSIITASNFSTAVNNNYGSILTAGTSSSATSTLTYSDISLGLSFVGALTSGFTKNDSILLVNFDQIPATYQDSDTGLTSPLYKNGSLVDILQTKPGHRTYNYDVTLVSYTGTTATFKTADFMTSQTSGVGSQQTIANVLVGDYMCLANECIIPQVPPDMHTLLAERTASKILQAIGDQAGMASSAMVIQKMEKSQGTLLDSRVENSARKINNRGSLLRYGKTRWP